MTFNNNTTDHATHLGTKKTTKIQRPYLSLSVFELYETPSSTDIKQFHLCKNSSERERSRDQSDITTILKFHRSLARMGTHGEGRRRDSLSVCPVELSPPTMMKRKQIPSKFINGPNVPFLPAPISQSQYKTPGGRNVVDGGTYNHRNNPINSP